MTMRMDNDSSHKTAGNSAVRDEIHALNEMTLRRAYTQAQMFFSVVIIVRID